MDFKKQLLDIIKNNETLMFEYNNINREIGTKDHIESILLLISKYGNHPKLILMLVMLLQLNEDVSMNDYSDEDIEKVFNSSIQLSDDSELLFEYFKFITIFNDAQSKIPNVKLIYKKIEDIENDINLIKSDEDFNNI